KITIRTDRSDAIRNGVFLDLSFPSNLGINLGESYSVADTSDVLAAPSPAGGDPSIAVFGLHESLISPDKATAPYTYNIAMPFTGGIPTTLAFRVHDSDLGRVKTPISAQGQAGLASRGSGPLYVPDQFFISQTLFHLPLPSTRTEFFSPGPVTWSTTMFQRRADQPNQTDLDGMLVSFNDSFAAGHRYHRPSHPPLLR